MCVEWKTRNLIKVYVNRMKELIMENEMYEIVIIREHDQIRGEINLLNGLEDLDRIRYE